MEDERNTQSHQSGEADQVEVKDRGLFDSLLGRKKQEEDKKQEEVLVTGMEKVSVENPEVTKEEHEAAGEKKESLLSKLHRSGSSSSSSSDEEEEAIDENGEIVKRKKKKGLKENIKEKLPGHKDHVEGEHTAAAPAPPPAPVVTHGEHHDTPAPFVTHGEHHDTPAPFVPHSGHNNTPTLSVAHGGHHDTDVVVEKIDGDVKTEAPVVPEEEKKGFLEKIKEKLPGGYKKPEDAAAVPATHAAPAPAHAPAPATEEVSSPDGKEKGILGKIMDKLPGYHKSAGEEEKAATATAGEHQTSG